MWKLKSSKKVYDHSRISISEDTVELPNGREISYLVYGDQNDAATVIARRNGKILLLHEHAYPINEKIYQFVEGSLENDENWKKGAKRELSEEAGLVANKLEKIGEFLLDHRRAKVVHHVVVADDLNETESDPELTEEMTSHWFSENEVMQMIANGDITQKNTLAAWSIYLATQQ